MASDLVWIVLGFDYVNRISNVFYYTSNFILGWEIGNNFLERTAHFLVWRKFSAVIAESVLKTVVRNDASKFLFQ